MYHRNERLRILANGSFLLVLIGTIIGLLLKNQPLVLAAVILFIFHLFFDAIVQLQTYHQQAGVKQFFRGILLTVLFIYLFFTAM